jgi:tetratricopeptide (TPR) repeat protein
MSIPEVVSAERVGPSVNDYDSEEALRKALVDNCTVQKDGQKTADWLLPVPDEEAEEQTVDTEVKRLWTLKSYLVLDAEKEAAFDRLTEEACRVFHVPTSNISLIDFGRQFAFSNTGTPGDVRETTRRVAFCAHAILSKTGICIVNDTHQDARFRNNDLVISPPHLRFYAGAPLISPEGYRLGTFCVEGPTPRPLGLSQTEIDLLKDFARRAMDLLVERRERLKTPIPSDRLRRHAAVVTNLGGYLYQDGECVSAMKLFQESVQTLMYIENEVQDGKPTTQYRSEDMEHIMRILATNRLSQEARRPLLEKVMSLVKNADTEVDRKLDLLCRSCIVDGIPGLFGTSSKLKITPGTRSFAQLVFSEPFTITLDIDPSGLPAEEKQFMIPIEQCSKATLFNMGVIHYHWGSPESAMQFFDLASSLSQQTNPLHFDPVILGCLNNMAQIHLQCGKPGDGIVMLSDALVRGNAALAAMYADGDGNRTCDIQRTRRLRRKLARTVMNLGHAHYLSCDYDASMKACEDALKLLHTCMEESEVAAIWYNIGVLHHHQGKRTEALKYLDLYLAKAKELLGTTHVQLADAYHLQGTILFEMGHLYQCMKPLNESLRIRCLNYEEPHWCVAESFRIIGKVLQAREEYDFALNSFQRSLDIERKLMGTNELSFDSAQTLLEVGRALHVQGNVKSSLDVYIKVAELTRTFFGDRHPFVARIDKILGNLYLEGGDVNKSLDLFTEAMQIQLENGMMPDLAVVQDRLCKVELQRHLIAASA